MHEDSSTLTIEEEALRRSAIIDAPEYEFPEDLKPLDVGIALVIVVMSVLSVYIASLV